LPLEARLGRMSTSTPPLKMTLQSRPVAASPERSLDSTASGSATLSLKLILWGRCSLSRCTHGTGNTAAYEQQVGRSRALQSSACL
jgi:hypothetical protein